MPRPVAALAVLATLAAPAAAAAPPPPEPAGPPPASAALVLRSTALRSRPDGRRIARITRRTEFGSSRTLGVVQTRGTWLRVRYAGLANGRTGWVSARDVLQQAIDWRIDVDLSQRQATVLDAGRVVQHFPVAVGRPGHPTPPGGYAVTDKIRFPHGGPYGCCAVALSGHQPHTPQGWSGGDRLAIHGTLDESTVGTAASLGCLRAHRAAVRRLMYSVPLGTPVEIRN